MVWASRSTTSPQKKVMRNWFSFNSYISSSTRSYSLFAHIRSKCLFWNKDGIHYHNTVNHDKFPDEQPEMVCLRTRIVGQLVLYAQSTCTVTSKQRTVITWLTVQITGKMFSIPVYLKHCLPSNDHVNKTPPYKRACWLTRWIYRVKVSRKRVNHEQVLLFK